MTEGRDAKLLQVLRREIRQHTIVYFVVAKRSLVFPEAQAPQPDHDVHGRLHSANRDNRLRPVVCKAGA